MGCDQFFYDSQGNFGFWILDFRFWNWGSERTKQLHKIIQDWAEGEGVGRERTTD